MGRFDHLSTSNLIKGIRENDQAQIRVNDALKTLSKPKALPYGKAAKEADFKEHCFVLCRLHQPDSVRHIEDLIKATNNQNPMKPRSEIE
jgi:hypothetical protein